MAKKLSGWYRLFIVFAGVWTLASIIVFYHYFPDKEYIVRNRLNDVTEAVSGFIGMDKSEQHKFLMGEWTGNNDYKELPEDEQNKYLSDIESGKVLMTDFFTNLLTDIAIREYHKERRNATYHFPLYWLVPIGLVYGIGWCVGWIIRGFRKED